MHMNVRSIDKHFEELQLLLNRIKTKIDVLVCTETRSLESPALYALKGYRYYYNNGKVTINDGVYVYVKEELEQSADHVEIGEITALKLKIGQEKAPLIVTAIYRSPSKNQELFVAKIQEYLEDNMQ